MNQHLSAKLAVFAVALITVANASCSKPGPTKDQMLSSANQAFAAGHYAEAEKQYRELLRVAPDEPQAVRQLGIIFQDQGELPQALPLLKRSAELRPDDVEVQLKLGLALQRLRQYKEAREAALRVLDKQPGREEALVLLANTALGLNDVDEMRKFIKGLRDKDQDRAGYHLAFGLFNLRQNDKTGAENEFKAALALDAKSLDALTLIGDLYWTRNDLKAADQAFKAAADLAPSRSLTSLQYVDFKLRTGAMADAEKILADIADKAPDYLPAQVYQMKIACAQRREEECATRTQNILAADPINFDALFEDGNLNLAKNDPTKAGQEFEYLSNNYSPNAQVKYRLALAYLLLANNASEADKRKDANSAESNLAEAIKLDPHFAQAGMLLAQLDIKKGATAAAVDLLTSLVKDQPNVAEAQYLLASAYLAQQQPTKALVVYRGMAELFPKDPQPVYLIGTMLLAQRQLAEARQAFEKSLEISSNYLPAAERLVDLDIAEKNYAAAMDFAQKLIDKQPKLGQAWAIRGKVYLAQRDVDHAEADLLKAVDLDPKLEPAYTLLAQIYIASNRQDQAIAKLKTAVEESKDDKDKAVPALVQLATLQQSLRHYSDARDAYEKVLTISPNLALAFNNLAVLYSDNLGQLDKAYDFAKKARDAVPNDPHIADTLGWILFKRAEYGNALPLLQESASKLSGEPDVQFHLGMTYYMLGQEEPARSALQKAVDAPAAYPGKEEARRRLALLAINVEAANAADVQTKLDAYLQEQPNDPQALLRLGEVQESEGALDQAAKTYSKIIEADQQFAPATRALALISGRRSPDDAKTYELAAKAHQAYPADPDIARVLGILNYRRGYYPQSVELLKEAAAKQNDNAEVFYYLGQGTRQLKQWSDCNSALKRAVSLNLSSNLAADANTALADCSTQFDRSEGIQSYRNGDYQKSSELLKDAVAKRNDDPELLYYLGQSYRQLKQREECKTALERSLGLSLPPNLVDEAKRALAECSEKPPT